MISFILILLVINLDRNCNIENDYNTIIHTMFKTIDRNNRKYIERITKMTQSNWGEISIKNTTKRDFPLRKFILMFIFDKY